MPLTVTAVVSNVVVLPCAMKYWTNHSQMGHFAGTAAAVVTYHVCQVAILHMYLYLFQPYQTECWPGLYETWKAATVSWKSFELFFYLGAGGILSSSECTCRSACDVAAKQTVLERILLCERWPNMFSSFCILSILCNETGIFWESLLSISCCFWMDIVLC
jgi:hypothetical protein